MVSVVTSSGTATDTNYLKKHAMKTLTSQQLKLRVNRRCGVTVDGLSWENVKTTECAVPAFSMDLATRVRARRPADLSAALHWYCYTAARERIDSTVPRSPPAGCRGGWGRSWLQTTGSSRWPGIGRQPDSATQRRWAPEQSARGRAISNRGNAPRAVSAGLPVPRRLSRRAGCEDLPTHPDKGVPAHEPDQPMAASTRRAPL